MAATTSRQVSATDMTIDESSLKTPTRHSFAGIAGQKPLPALPALPQLSTDQTAEPQISIESRTHRDSLKSEEDGSDIEMEDAKSPKDSEDSIDGADADGAEGADGKASKKKKGQRFFCSDFPPCTLSFTRSEHLARHIRKHTGERPFQCHCGRRFSRLDNLRQHAQTVHVNEDIPIDSLASNGARFQRQIRTERARPTGRSRSSTFTSGVPPTHLAHMHRGHSRNLSSSSVASMVSVSTLGGDDFRRTPLGFETPRSNRLSLDTFSTSCPTAPTTAPYYGVGENSPAGYSTPNSFSHGHSSPRFSSGIHSPMTNTSRSSYWASKTPHRRLSMSGAPPFQSAHSPDLQSSAQHSPAPSHAALQRHSHYTPSPGPSGLYSPRDSPATPVDSEYRRHTWQPQINTQLRRPRIEQNILTASHITDLPRPRPVFPSLDSPQQNVTRLPGIHTFDQPPPPSALLNARAPSPMQMDGAPTSHPVQTPVAPAQLHPLQAHPVQVQASSYPEQGHGAFTPAAAPATQPVRGPSHHRGVSWTSGIQKDMNRLDIAHDPRPTSWASSSHPPIPESPTAASRGHTRHTSDSSVTSAPSSTPTARKNKRMGWYIQPPSHEQVPKPERPSPDSSDGAPTPITTSAGFQPAIVNQSNGHIEPQGLGLSHVEESPKTSLISPPTSYQPIRPEQRLSISSRSHERYSNPFGLQKVHEHAPAEHFHHVPHYARAIPEDRRGLDALVAAATSDGR